MEDQRDFRLKISARLGRSEINNDRIGKEIAILRTEQMAAQTTEMRHISFSFEDL